MRSIILRRIAAKSIRRRRPGARNGRPAIKVAPAISRIMGNRFIGLPSRLVGIYRCKVGNRVRTVVDPDQERPGEAPESTGAWPERAAGELVSWLSVFHGQGGR
jgi:hypothetical protein